MAYTYQEMIDAAKREARAGVVGDYAEQYTLDLLGYLNRVALSVWAMNDWDYSKTDILLTVPANTNTTISLNVAVAEVIVIGIQGQAGYLRTFTEKQYRQWKKRTGSQAPPTTTPVGNIYGYVHRGLDATGAVKLLFVDPPLSDTILEGEGKTRFNKITLADVQAGTTIPYFPDQTAAIIQEWVAGIFMTAINDSRGPGIESKARAAIEGLIGSERTDDSDDVTTPPPDLCMYNARNRGGVRVV